MTREIKFRGWNGKRMTREYTLNEMLVQKLDHNGLKENWMQFTGLLDRNGKEIYEGDIVEYFVKDNGIGKFLVKWNENGFWDCGINNDMQEIIGNVFENPELLTK